MPERVIDLRSDTVTLPTPEMKAAMADAALGDDCYGEDPTVNRLEELAAETMGTEAAVFVASGTMGNTCALLAHTRLGDEIIVEENYHIYQWEAGAYANIAGVAVRAVEAADGIIRPAQLEDLVRPTTNPHMPLSSLLCIENTHNYGIGSAWTPAEVEAVAAAAHGYGLKVHMDGARVFNAAVAVGVDVKDFARHVDSVTFCLSKGLSAPVGSVLCGSEELKSSCTARDGRASGWVAPCVRRVSSPPPASSPSSSAETGCLRITPTPDASPRVSARSTALRRRWRRDRRTWCSWMSPRSAGSRLTSWRA